MSTRDYDVLEPLSHDGTRYEPGAVVELTDRQAKPLKKATPPVVRARPASRATSGGDKKTAAKKTAAKKGDSGDSGEAAARHALLKEFMAELEVPADTTGSDFWTNDGKPDANALADAMGIESISAAERDAAWNEVLAERESGGGAS